ncbi:MAG: DUF4199 domain-containing protein [Sphingobacteriales bacterium]|nr:MAG: DUF4199 domain-containing protein [Sphingobacteriales bacterium]
MKKLSATYKGLIIAGLMIIVSATLFYGFKFPPNDSSQLVVMGLYIMGIFWSLISLKPTEEKALRFKDYFSQGFKTFIIVTLLMVIYTAVFYKLNPQILENVIAENEILVAKAGDKTPAEIKANSESLRSIFMPMTISLTTVIYLGLGALTSVVGGLILLNSQKK